MFKRVQKRLRKREREEELGIDGDMKEVLGLQDTDSDESDSSSEEEGSDAEAQDGADDDGEDSQDDESVVLEEEEEGDAEVSDTESDDDEGLPEISVTEAVKNPVYIVSIQPKVEACILCPGKLLKNQKMSEVHKASKAHNRRFSRFVELVGKAGPEADVRALIRDMKKSVNPSSQATPTEDAPSKRALKRKEKLAAIKAKRAAKKKAAEKARKRIEKKKASTTTDAPNNETESEQPVKKKRKTEGDAKSAKSPVSPIKTDDGKEQDASLPSNGQTAPTTPAKSKAKVKRKVPPARKSDKPEKGVKATAK